MNLFLFPMLLMGCCGYALVRGGEPERAAGALLITAFALGLPVHQLVDASGYRSTLFGTGSIDLALLVALTVLAWRSNRFWPIWIAGWQLAAVMAHVAKTLDPTMLSTGYAVQAQLWCYPMVLAVAAGTWRHRSRVAAGDPDPAWKAFAN